MTSKRNDPIFSWSILIKILSWINNFYINRVINAFNLQQKYCYVIFAETWYYICQFLNSVHLIAVSFCLFWNYWSACLNMLSWHMQNCVFARYEMHYNTLHRYVCSSCHRCFPTQHLLDLHLLEWHDTMFELKSASQKMVYSVTYVIILMILQEIVWIQGNYW